MKKQSMWLILAINVILSADQLTLDNNVTEANTSSNSIQKESNRRQNNCHTFNQNGRGYHIHHDSKCVKSVDNNLTLSNLYSYIRSM